MSNNITNIRPREDFLIHNGFKKRIPAQTIRPLGSKLFTPYTIMKILKSKFKDSWTCTVTSSPKLEFYSQLKSNFIKESYLDNVANYIDRANITRIRISAHRLEVELGRRNKIPRIERTCSWCEKQLGTRNVEDEHHFLVHCNLYEPSRNKVHKKIHDILHDQSTPYPSHQHNPLKAPLTSHLHFITENSEIYKSLSAESQVHMSRVVARFVTSCFKNRKNYIDSLTCCAKSPAANDRDSPRV